jgi:hypothetical protein
MGAPWRRTYTQFGLNNGLRPHGVRRQVRRKASYRAEAALRGHCRCSRRRL